MCIRDRRWRIPELLARMDEAPDFYFDSISQVVMPQWAHGLSLIHI